MLDNSADRGKIQRDEEEILREIVSKVKNFIEYGTDSLAQSLREPRKSEKLKKISISVDGKDIFKLNKEKEGKPYSVSLEDLQRVKKAIYDTQNSTGIVKIRLGKETLFYSNGNKLVTDRLNIARVSKQELPLTTEQKIEKLSNLVGKQQEKIELLERRIEQKLKFVAQNTSQLQNKKLKGWINNVGNKLSAGWNQLRSKISNFVNTKIRNTGEKLINLSASVMEKPVNLLLDKYGSQDKPGVVSFQGQKYSFSRDIKSGEISIVSNKGKERVFEKGEFTQKASPEDIKILRTLPDKVNNRTDRKQNIKKSRGFTR